MSAHTPTVATFLRDVSSHQLTIKHEAGVYRHLQFAEPDSSVMWFDIVTWPGFLAYTGDMGAFTFSRIPDMLQFFRDGKDAPLRINESYWHEKVVALDRGSRERRNSSYRFVWCCYALAWGVRKYDAIQKAETTDGTV